jgi:nitrogen-specific signal transduction histidine kinase/CheY-like chemotaxis protein
MQLFHRDIMEKKKLQEQLLQSQKMESVGVLAGGIAHDFNNVLTAILGHAEVLRRRVRDDEFARRTIKIIEDAGIRAGQMVSKLLSFARKENFALSPTDLNAVVSDTVELLQHALMSRAIRVGMSTAPGLPAVMGDAVHLGQVIANLVMNSMDAMPEGGSITVSTSVETLGDEAPHVHPLLAPGTYAVLTVADTGAGIPREIMDRIFDPFFTTKPAGKGTGLGLAMVYGIVKSHGGEIRVESRMGEGARFSLYFPVAPQLAWSFTPGRADDAAPAGGAGILVVDDDKDVLTAVKDILEPRGYRVIVTDSPVHAHDLFSRISENIDLVITDMMMPHINGGDLARQLKDFRHTVKVIGISGLDPAALFRQTQEIDRFLRKPFDSSALLSAVREVLHATQ